MFKSTARWAQPVAQRGFARAPSIRQISSSREAGSSAAFPEPPSASERCSTRQQELQQALVELQKDCHGRLLTSRRPRQCHTLRAPRDHTYMPRIGSPAPGSRRGGASAPRRSARSTKAKRAAARIDLVVFGLRVVPTARRSHTTGAGHAPMRPPRVSSLGRGTFAHEVDPCAWRPRPIERL